MDQLHLRFKNRNGRIFGGSGQVGPEACGCMLPGKGEVDATLLYGIADLFYCTTGGTAATGEQNDHEERK